MTSRSLVALSLVLIAVGAWIIYSNVKTAKVQFEITDCDLGDVPVGSTRFCEFHYKNCGSEPLHVRDVRGSCGCITDSSSHKPISPGDTGVIKVGLKAADQPSVKMRKVPTVSFEPRNIEDRVLSLSADTRPYITIQPARLRILRNVKADSVAAGRLRVKRGLLNVDKFKLIEIDNSLQMYSIEKIFCNDEEIEFSVGVNAYGLGAYPAIGIKYLDEKDEAIRVPVPIDVHEPAEIRVSPSRYFRALPTAQVTSALGELSAVDFRVQAISGEDVVLTDVSVAMPEIFESTITSTDQGCSFRLSVKRLPANRVSVCECVLHYVLQESGVRGDISVPCTLYLK